MKRRSIVLRLDIYMESRRIKDNIGNFQKINFSQFER